MIKQGLKRLRIFLGITFVIIFTFCIALPTLNKRAELLQKNKELLEKIKLLELEIEELRKKETATQNDPYYLEKLARNKLGYSGPDEVIYQFD